MREHCGQLRRLTQDIWKIDLGQKNNSKPYKCFELPDIVLVGFMVGFNLKIVGITGLRDRKISFLRFGRSFKK